MEQVWQFWHFQSFLKPCEATMFYEICNILGGAGSFSLEIRVGVGAVKRDGAKTKKSEKSMLVNRPLRCSQYEFPSEQATAGLLSVLAKTLRLPVLGYDLQIFIHVLFAPMEAHSLKSSSLRSHIRSIYAGLPCGIARHTRRLCPASMRNYPRQPDSAPPSQPEGTKRQRVRSDACKSGGH